MTIQHYYLQQMGISPWLVRSQDDDKVDPNNQQLDPDVVINELPVHSKKPLMIIVDGLEASEEPAPGSGWSSPRRLLNKMLTSIGLHEKDVCMMHCLKWAQEEIKGRVYDAVIQKIKRVDPKVILLLGPSMGNLVLKLDLSFDEMRLKQHRHDTIPVLVSYHPGDLLEKPVNKKNAYYDWVALHNLLMADS